MLHFIIPSIDPFLPLDVAGRSTQFAEDLPELLPLLAIRAGCDVGLFDLTSFEDDNFVSHSNLSEKENQSCKSSYFQANQAL